MKTVYSKSLIIILCGLGSLFTATDTLCFNHQHEMLNQILKKHVMDGWVDYKSLKESRRTFDSYISELASVTEDEMTKWSRNEKLAYWINAYNAYTIKSIIDHYPVKSIKKISGVWDKTKHRAGGTGITLNDIEHKRLRAELAEPRIHFAINCASIGCPRLSNEAYRAKELDAQLDRGVAAMLENRSQFRMDNQKMVLHLSKILKWFGEDFAGYKGAEIYGRHNGIVSFTLNYLPKAKQNFIKNHLLKIKWLDYNWDLNQKI